MIGELFFPVERNKQFDKPVDWAPSRATTQVPCTVDLVIGGTESSDRLSGERPVVGLRINWQYPHVVNQRDNTLCQTGNRHHAFSKQSAAVWMLAALPGRGLLAAVCIAFQFPRPRATTAERPDGTVMQTMKVMSFHSGSTKFALRTNSKNLLRRSLP
jgi:hypothetical protein